MEQAISCPLTQHRMQDPVFAADGYCYEKTNIQKYLLTSTRSPVTNEFLEHITLTPAHTIRMLIEAAGDDEHQAAAARARSISRGYQDDEELPRKTPHTPHTTHTRSPESSLVTTPPAAHRAAAQYVTRHPDTRVLAYHCPRHALPALNINGIKEDSGVDVWMGYAGIIYVAKTADPSATELAIQLVTQRVGNAVALAPPPPNWGFYNYTHTRQNNIKHVVGRGGATLRKITESCNVSVEIAKYKSDPTLMVIFGKEYANVQMAKAWLKRIDAEEY